MKKILLNTLLLLFCVSCEALFVENISDKTVAVLAPQSETVLDAGNITFVWDELEDADEYLIRIVTPNFENASQLILNTTITDTSITQNLAAGDYQWYVIAKNTEYQTEENIFTLTIN